MINHVWLRDPVLCLKGLQPLLDNIDTCRCMAEPVHWCMDADLSGGGRCRGAGHAAVQVCGEGVERAAGGRSGGAALTRFDLLTLLLNHDRVLLSFDGARPCSCVWLRKAALVACCDFQPEPCGVSQA